jgi:hypothetical protein
VIKAMPAAKVEHANSAGTFTNMATNVSYWQALKGADRVSMGE